MTNHPLKGALFLLAGEFLLAAMAASIKHSTTFIPHELLVFGRNLFGLLALLPLLILHPVSLRTDQLKLHLLRSLIGLTAMYGYFYVIAHIPLTEAILVKFTAPFFLPLIAFLWLGEPLAHKTYWAIAIGFIGITLILQPGSDQFSPVALVGIAAAACASVAKVCIRRMASTEPNLRIVFYFALISTTVSCIPLTWSWQSLSWQHWSWLIVVGCLGTGGQVLMTQAYRIAQPGQVGIYTYSAVIYASLIGWIVWGELLNLLAWIGTGLVILAGIWNLKVTKNNHSKSID